MSKEKIDQMKENDKDGTTKLLIVGLLELYKNEGKTDEEALKIIFGPTIKDF